MGGGHQPTRMGRTDENGFLRINTCFLRTNQSDAGTAHALAAILLPPALQSPEVRRYRPGSDAGRSCCALAASGVSQWCRRECIKVESPPWLHEKCIKHLFCLTVGLIYPSSFAPDSSARLNLDLVRSCPLASLPGDSPDTLIGIHHTNRGCLRQEEGCGHETNPWTTP